MRPFEYANPQTEAEALELLNDRDGNTAVLAGGTDLINLMKREVVTPERVVDIKQVASMRGVHPYQDGLLVGALSTLEELLEDPMLADYRSMADVVNAIRAIQIQQTGTLGGDLCHLPNCWYFRNGYGLFGTESGRSLVADGDNRYHAILGNRGPAKFVNASRFAPALIAWEAQVRVIGPKPTDEMLLPLAEFYQSPKTDRQGVTVLKPGQLISHVWLPPSGRVLSATYEVLQMQGLDWPTAAAACCLEMDGTVVRQARIVLGHVAPMPWVAEQAARAMVGRPVNAETVEIAAQTALADATPLSGNEYKVQQSRAAVKRTLLRATGQLDLA